MRISGVPKAGDLRSHFIEQRGTVPYLGLASSADDDRFPLGQRSGTHDVDGSQHGRPMSAAQIHPAALQTAIDRTDNIAIFGAEFSPHLFQPAHMQIDRAIANSASAGDADQRPAALGEQWSGTQMLARMVLTMS